MRAAPGRAHLSLMPPITMDAAHAEALRATLLEMEELDRELSRRRKEQGIRYYTPNPVQAKAHRSVANTILFCGGNRSGKSTFGAVELAWHLTRDYPDWYPPERRYKGPIKAVIVATEFPVVQRVIEPKIMAYVPKSAILKMTRTPQGYLSRVVLTDGSTIDVLTNEMAQMAFESADWDFAWIDEPTQRSRYVAVRRGLVDRMGRMVITFTPIVEPWMKEELVDAADGKMIQCFTAHIRDNMFDVAGAPIQSDKAIRMFEMALTPDEKATRLEGKFFHLRGVVYQSYTPSIHERLLKHGYQYPDPVVCVLDPHTRKPHHAIWAIILRDNTIYVDQELVIPGTLKELSKAILLTEQKSGYRMRKRLIDPNFGRTPNLVTGRSVIDEMRQPPFPVHFGEADDDKEAGILKVRSLLHWDITKPIGALNTPKLFFHPRCTKTIKSIRNYQFDEWRGVAKDTKDPKEVEKQKDTDGADCVRYLCLAAPRYEALQHRDAARELEESPY